MPELADTATTADLTRVRRAVDALLEALDDAEQQWSPWIEQTTPEHRRSAVNLTHYWALRQTDLRELQGDLADLGLSSLGRSEAHVEATLRLVAAALTAIAGEPYVRPENAVVGVDEGPELLRRNATDLLGAPPEERSVRIMVTLPSKAATDRQLIADLVDNGMNVARINCAHDDAEAWRAMAAEVRRAAQRAGRDVVIAMDLAGPKLRTGPLKPSDDSLRLQAGDVVRLTRDCSPAPVDADPPHIGCTLAEAFDRAEAGQRVFFDDGKLGGVIVEAGRDALGVRIEAPALDSAKLKGGKGINLPDTELPISALTDKDIEDLRTVVDVADVVEYSFVRTPEDISTLFTELDRLGADDIGVVLKIETRPAFENLPQ